LIRAETSAHVLIVHHVGLPEDAQTRPRGNSALTAAADICVLVAKTKSGVDLTVTVERDGLEGKKIKAKFASFKTGVDDRGKDLTVPYLELVKVHEPEDRVATPDTEDEGGGDVKVGKFTFVKPDDKAKPKATASEERALVALARAIKAHGFVAADDTAGFPDDVPTVSISQWRAAYEEVDTRVGEACLKAFKRVVETLAKNGRVTTRNDRVWPSE
jgi:hypothetical protein